jgi:hypothetical protein
MTIRIATPLLALLAVASSIGPGGTAAQDVGTGVLVVEIGTELAVPPPRLGSPTPSVTSAGLLATCEVIVYRDLSDVRVPDQLAEQNAVPSEWIGRISPDDAGRATFELPAGRYSVLQRGCIGERTADTNPGESDFSAECCVRLQGEPELVWVRTESEAPAFQVQIAEVTQGATANVSLSAVAESETSNSERWFFAGLLAAVLGVIAVFGIVRWLRPTYGPRSSLPAKSLPPETEEEKQRRRVTFEDVFGDAVEERRESEDRD